MKMNGFTIFKKNMFVCSKSSNIEGNTGRSTSDLTSVDAKYSSDLLSKKYIVNIIDFHF